MLRRIGYAAEAVEGVFEKASEIDFFMTAAFVENGQRFIRTLERILVFDFSMRQPVTDIAALGPGIPDKGEP